MGEISPALLEALWKYWHAIETGLWQRDRSQERTDNERWRGRIDTWEKKKIIIIMEEKQLGYGSSYYRTIIALYFKMQTGEEILENIFTRC